MGWKQGGREGREGGKGGREGGGESRGGEGGSKYCTKKLHVRVCYSCSCTCTQTHSLSPSLLSSLPQCNKSLSHLSSFLDSAAAVSAASDTSAAISGWVGYHTALVANQAIPFVNVFMLIELYSTDCYIIIYTCTCIHLSR